MLKFYTSFTYWWLFFWWWCTEAKWRQWCLLKILLEGRAPLHTPLHALNLRARNLDSRSRTEISRLLRFVESDGYTRAAQREMILCAERYLATLMAWECFRDIRTYKLHPAASASASLSPPTSLHSAPSAARPRASVPKDGSWGDASTTLSWTEVQGLSSSIINPWVYSLTHSSTLV